MSNVVDMSGEFGKPSRGEFPQDENGYYGSPSYWLEFTCSCGWGNFFIAKPHVDAQPKVYCRHCAKENFDWF